jgi:hypothetical protein
VGGDTGWKETLRLGLAGAYIGRSYLKSLRKPHKRKLEFGCFHEASMKCVGKSDFTRAGKEDVEAAGSEYPTASMDRWSLCRAILKRLGRILLLSRK